MGVSGLDREGPDADIVIVAADAGEAGEMAYAALPELLSWAPVMTA